MFPDGRNLQDHIDSNPHLFLEQSVLAAEDGEAMDCDDTTEGEGEGETQADQRLLGETCAYADDEEEDDDDDDDDDDEAMAQA